MTDREKHLAGQRRYNASPKGRARYARYRAAHPDRLAETRARDNESRIFIGSHYVAREGRFPYPREVVEQYLGRLYSEFRQTQTEADAAFRESLEGEVPPSVIELPDLLEVIQTAD